MIKYNNIFDRIIIKCVWKKLQKNKMIKKNLKKKIYLVINNFIKTFISLL